MQTIVNKRKMDDEKNPVVKMNNNPILDTISHRVKFYDVTTKVITANIIANNLLAQVDEKGHHQMILDSIIYHRQDAFMETKNAMKQRKITRAGWQL